MNNSSFKKRNMLKMQKVDYVDERLTEYSVLPSHFRTSPCEVCDWSLVLIQATEISLQSETYFRSL